MADHSGLTPFDAFKLQKMTYLFNDQIMEGAVNVIAGPSGVGKSLVSVAILREVCRKHNAIASLMEDAPFISKARMRAAGVNTQKVFLPDVSYFLPDDYSRFEDDIIRTKAKVAILDTAAKHLNAPMSNDQKVAQALAPLAMLAAKHKVTIILITHTNKTVKRSSSPLDVVGGSRGGLVGTARCVLIFGKMIDGSDARAMVCVKDSYRERPAPMSFTVDSDLIEENGIEVDAGYLNIEDDSLQVADNDAFAINLLMGSDGEGKTGPKPDKRDDCAEWLTNLLALAPVPGNDKTLTNGEVLQGVKSLAAEAKFSWATVRRAADEIGVERGRGPGAVWELPAGHPARAY